MTTTGAATQPQQQTLPTNGAQPASGKAKEPEKPASTAVAKLSPAMALFKEKLEQISKQIEIALPKHVDKSRFIRVVQTTVQRNPDLLDCTPYSLFSAILQCAQLGLEPDGILGHAYLVPFNEKGTKKCQIIIGYKGYIKLARQSGEVLNVDMRAVYSGDKFEYEYGTTPHIKHVPSADQEPGDLTHVYAVVFMVGGGVHFDVMSAWQVEQIRKNAKSGTSPAWRDHYDEQAKKTVFRRCAKAVPSSVEKNNLARAIALDELHDAGLNQDFDADVIDVPEGNVTQGSAGNGTATPATPEFVVSTLKQRKDIARLIAEARVAEADVAGWFNRPDNKRETIEQLSRAEAEDAIKRLGEVVAAENATEPR